MTFTLANYSILTSGHRPERPQSPHQTVELPTQLSENMVNLQTSRGC
jgi:hypothetical protein